MKGAALKKVFFDLARYLAALFFLYLISLQLQLGWEVFILSLLGVWLQLSQLELPFLGGRVYNWYIWSLLLPFSVAEVAVTLFVSFFFQKGLNTKNWRSYFDHFVNTMIVFALVGFCYKYLTGLFSSSPLTLLLFLAGGLLDFMVFS